MKCLFCGRDGFAIEMTGYALCPEDMKKVQLCFSIRDQIMELYRTMVLHGLIPKDGTPTGEGIPVKRGRGRPPKRQVEGVAPATEVGEGAVEVQQLQAETQE